MGERGGTDSQRQIPWRLPKHRVTYSSTVGYWTDARAEGHSRCAKNGSAREEGEQESNPQHARQMNTKRNLRENNLSDETTLWYMWEAV